MNKERDFITKWSILKRVSPRTAGRSTCNLCLDEKLSILESDSARTLNKRSELSRNGATATLAREILNARVIQSETLRKTVS